MPLPNRFLTIPAPSEGVKDWIELSIISEEVQ